MGLKIALVQEKRTFALFHIPWKRWVKREKKGANFFDFPPPRRQLVVPDWLNKYAPFQGDKDAEARFCTPHGFCLVSAPDSFPPFTRFSC